MLLNRDFVLLWQGQLVSQLGNQAFLIATMFWTMEVTGSAGFMGLLMAASTLPGVLLGPVGGTFADRHSRLSIIISADVVRGVAALGLAWALAYSRLPTDWLLALLFGVALLYGVAGAFFNPAITAALPDLVPTRRLAAANSMQQFSAQGATLLGQGIAGVLYRLLGAPSLFLLDGLTYLFSAGSEAFVRLPRIARPDALSWRESVRAFARDTTEGIQYVWRRAGMRDFLLTASLFNFLMMPILVLLPFYVQGVLDARVDWYGFLLAAVSGGSLLGFTLAALLPLDGKRRVSSILGLFTGTALLMGTLGLISTAPLALSVFLLVGTMAGMINIYMLTLLQVGAPAQLRGRVMGLVVTLAGGLTPLGMAVGGWVGDLTGKNIPLIYIACGGLAVVLTLALGGRRSTREFLAHAG